MSKKHNSLLQKVATIRPPSPKNFIDKFTEEQRRELFELRAQYAAGKIKGATGQIPSVTEIWKLVCQEFGNKIGSDNFRRWMRQA
jgi:ribosomal protein L29